ncbi:Uncharacterised protein [Mycobacteroides abscessus subsp. abscessus]|nr:Uncharacterised protein [Mycobacteroides abscessus subsp. abscessus]
MKQFHIESLVQAVFISDIETVIEFRPLTSQSLWCININHDDIIICRGLLVDS